jgi:hypothetical protein
VLSMHWRPEYTAPFPAVRTYARTHARTHAHTDALWFTVTGPHTFITTTGTGTLMSQHHLHHVDESTPTAPHCL